MKLKRRCLCQFGIGSAIAVTFGTTTRKTLAGFGDNEPPAIRADAVPATLQTPNGFKILILTFVAWDVIKFRWSIKGGREEVREVKAGKTEMEFFQPARSGYTYIFTAQGCAKAIDGSTKYCSPISNPIEKVAANNTNSLRRFLQISGINLNNKIGLRSTIKPNSSEIHLRAIMGLE